MIAYLDWSPALIMFLWYHDKVRFSDIHTIHEGQKDELTRWRHIHTLHEGHKNEKCRSCDKYFSQYQTQHLKRHIHTI